MGNKYVYVLFDSSNGDLGTFTSPEKAAKAAIDNGFCMTHYNDEISTPEQVFKNKLMTIEKIPLNCIY